MLEENEHVQELYSRIDELQETFFESMENENIFEFVTMSIVFPLFGMVLNALGGSPLISGILGLIGPMSLLNHVVVLDDDHEI